MKMSLTSVPITSTAVDIAKAGGMMTRAQEPKTVMYDPLSIVDIMGYRRRPGFGRAHSLSYETLRRMSMRNAVVAAILQTRQNQVGAFASPSDDARDSVGFVILPRDGKQPSRAAKKEITRLNEFILNTGNSELMSDGTDRDRLGTFLRKITRDTLVFDQVNIEIVRDRMGRPYDFYAVDAATIRKVIQPGKDKNDFKEPIIYVQVLNDAPVAGYSSREMVFGVRNPRTDILSAGYGYAELEMLITTITAHLNAEEYNRKFFEHGSVPKGILNIKGSNIPREQMEGVRRMWNAQMAGVMNAWRTPVMNAEELQWVNVHQSNMDMEFSRWLEYLVKVASAVFLIDPAEINFDFRGSATQQAPLFESSIEGKLKHSKDRGLRPLLRFLMEVIDQKIIRPLNSDFKFAFSGLDARTEQELLTMDKDKVETYMTVNEVRKTRGLDPLEGELGELIMNPTFMQWALQKEAGQGGNGVGFAGFGEMGGAGNAEETEEAEKSDRDAIRILVEKAIV